MAEVEEVLQLIAREKDLNAKILAQRASGKSGGSDLNVETRSRSSTCLGFRAPSVLVQAPQQARSAQGLALD